MDIRFIGESLCLDFVNTVHNYGSADPREELNSFEDLVVWGQRAGIIKTAEIRHLSHTARRKPSKAERFLKHVKHLRRSLYGVFYSISKKRPIEQSHLPLIKRHLSRSLKHMTIRIEQGRYRLSPDQTEPSANRLLSMILESTLRLLISEQDLLRVRQCEGENCTWLFLDRSKNRSRKWCEMESCGSRAKARRYYYRKRKQK